AGGAGDQDLDLLAAVELLRGGGCGGERGKGEQCSHNAPYPRHPEVRVAQALACARASKDERPRCASRSGPSPFEARTQPSGCVLAPQGDGRRLVPLIGPHGALPSNDHITWRPYSISAAQPHRSTKARMRATVASGPVTMRRAMSGGSGTRAGTI